ncbi:ArsR family transcriptional regulator [Candidatus Pacearchaeota archaeon]|nr:MAG: ArsR family transcriptional regulator [Candidatus Pacearchaeota archaeon]
MGKNILKNSKAMRDAYDRFLTTLRNKTRLAIIQALSTGPKNVMQLTRELGVHQTTVSHGLRRLLDCGFVFVKKNGKERVYKLNERTIKPLAKLMERHVKNYCSKGKCARW